MPLLTRSRGRQRFFNQPFSPSQLFRGGIQGAWYDPSDNATMFQDAAGLTPVTAVEQPVGLVFDKRLGPTARRNLLTYTEQFDNAAWATLNASISANATTAPDGTATADAIIENTSSGLHLAYYIGAPLVVGVNCASVYVKAAGRNFAILRITNPAVSISVNLTTLVAVAAEGTPVGTTVTDVGNGWRRISFSAAQVGSGQVQVWASIDGTINPYTGDGTSGVYAWGAQLEAASTASTYQKITSGVGGEWTPGNHAYQSTAASRPVLRARYNLLTYSEQFDNAAWTLIQILPFGSGSVVNAAIAPDGTTTADLITQNTSGADAHLVQSIITPVTGGSIITASVYLRKPTSNGARYAFVVINDMTAVNCPVLVDLDTGSVVNFTGYPAYGAPLSSSSVNVGGGWWRVTLSYQLSAGITQSRVFIGIAANGNPASSPIFTGDGTSGIFVWGAQLLTAADATATGNAYQRIVGAATYATGGVFRPYLAFDGVDDSLGFTHGWTGSQAFSLFSAGKSELTPTGSPQLRSFVSLGTSGGRNGVDLGWGWTQTQYDFAVSGLLPITGTAANYPGNIIQTALYNGVFNYTYRENGTQNGTLVDTAALALSSSALLGSRFGTLSQCRIYGLIVRGAASSTVEVAQTESWLNAKTGAY